MSKAREVARALERAGVVLPVHTWAKLVDEIESLYDVDASLHRAHAHISRGADIIRDLVSHLPDTIEDNDRS
jgi:hypothetical protein